MVTKRDIGLSLLFLLGFPITYVEGLGIMAVNQYFYPNESWVWESWRPIGWMIIFGIFHSMILFKLVFRLEKWISVKGD